MEMRDILVMLDETLNTKRRRHLTGGILLSVSLLFSGLAITVMTLNEKEETA